MIHLSIIEMTPMILAIRRICYRRDYLRYKIKCSYGHWHSLQLLFSAHSIALCHLDKSTHFILCVWTDFSLKNIFFRLCNFSRIENTRRKQKKLHDIFFLIAEKFSFRRPPALLDFLVTWKLTKRNCYSHANDTWMVEHCFFETLCVENMANKKNFHMKSFDDFLSKKFTLEIRWEAFEALWQKSLKIIIDFLLKNHYLKKFRNFFNFHLNGKKSKNQ